MTLPTHVYCLILNHEKQKKHLNAVKLKSYDTHVKPGRLFIKADPRALFFLFFKSELKRTFSINYLN